MLGAAAAALGYVGFWRGRPGSLFLKWAGLAAPAALGGLVISAVVANWQSPHMYFYGFAAVEALTLLVILDVLYHPEGWVAKLLAMRWLVWVGTISYGLYIWHYPLFQLLLFGFHWPPGAVAMAGSLMAILISAVSFYAVERPALRLKSRFE